MLTVDWSVVVSVEQCGAVCSSSLGNTNTLVRPHHWTGGKATIIINGAMWPGGQVTRILSSFITKYNIANLAGSDTDIRMYQVLHEKEELSELHFNKLGEKDFCTVETVVNFS